MRTRLAMLLAVIVGLGGIAPGAGHARAADPASPGAVLRIGLSLQPTNALVIVALNRRYFAEQGLRVATMEYPSGKVALENGLFAGKVDLVTASDAPIALFRFARSDFKVIATVFAVDNQNRVVARRDRGIAAPADLRGKRVATQGASAVHYFLSLFLADHGIGEDDVALSLMPAHRLPAALAAGDIDAFAMREPYISHARALLADNAVVFDAPGLYDQTDQIVVSERFAESRPDAIVRIVRALIQAEDYVRAGPARAQDIVAARLGVPPARITATWPRRLPRVMLEQSLLSRLEAQARWAMAHDIAPAGRVPNYLDVIHLRALAEVKPKAVTVVR